MARVVNLPTKANATYDLHVFGDFGAGGWNLFVSGAQQPVCETWGCLAAGLQASRSLREASNANNGLGPEGARIGEPCVPPLS
jgi:hypothetical protein